LGQTAAQLARKHASKVFQKAFQDISAKEIELLINLLQRVFGNLRDGI
jgi:hypothetical protein